ncbi:Hypothetical Protein FCC1311_107322 [Hondaea fermentalgiana]|uniref:Uncharacterized protein n=1 Tax=Hondaea fermentalgiana TaxID=2315210 RepID=A0A2R5GXJ1_9STRA|nr:Hypothetical Protein FCC1311_107322 [Hondaea fermentalgiana]|eukprot:GBG34508.1 Hypothetical Protein FCC1311_107322 [Hondaea fermentalgiana]
MSQRKRGGDLVEALVATRADVARGGETATRTACAILQALKGTQNGPHRKFLLRIFRWLAQSLPISWAHALAEALEEEDIGQDAQLEGLLIVRGAFGSETVTFKDLAQQPFIHAREKEKCIRNAAILGLWAQRAQICVHLELLHQVISRENAPSSTLFLMGLQDLRDDIALVAGRNADGREPGPLSAALAAHLLASGSALVHADPAWEDADIAAKEVSTCLAELDVTTQRTQALAAASVDEATAEDRRFELDHIAKVQVRRLCLLLGRMRPQFYVARNSGSLEPFTDVLRTRLLELVGSEQLKLRLASGKVLGQTDPASIVPFLCGLTTRMQSNATARSAATCTEPESSGPIGVARRLASPYFAMNAAKCISEDVLPFMQTQQELTEDLLGNNAQDTAVRDLLFARLSPLLFLTMLPLSTMFAPTSTESTEIAEALLLRCIAVYEFKEVRQVAAQALARLHRARVAIPVVLCGLKWFVDQTANPALEAAEENHSESEEHIAFLVWTKALQRLESNPNNDAIIPVDVSVAKALVVTAQYAFAQEPSGKCPQKLVDQLFHVFAKPCRDPQSPLANLQEGCIILLSSCAVGTPDAWKPSSKAKALVQEVDPGHGVTASYSQNQPEPMPSPRGERVRLLYLGPKVFDAVAQQLCSLVLGGLDDARSQVRGAMVKLAGALLTLPEASLRFPDGAMAGLMKKLSGLANMDIDAEVRLLASKLAQQM